MPTSTATSGPSTLSNSLARDRIGAPGIGLAIASSVAPLTVVAGVVTTAIAVTGLTAVSAAMLAVAFALILFAVGYVAMARHITNTGAFYAYISKGLGRPLGVGASWIALLAYNSFQVASYGGFGFILAPLFESWFGLDLPWWPYAVVAWAIVAYLGQRDVSVSEKVLAVLVISETILVVAYAVVIFSTEGFQFDGAAWDFGQVFGAGGGALLAVAATGFAGVEQGAVYIEESKDPKRSVARATFATIVLIALLYSVASWVQISAAGDQVVDRARAEGPNLFFIEAGSAGNWTVDVGNLLFATSLLAAMIAFHNIIARYTYALGREGVLPTLFGRTVGGAPRNASFAQSALALVVILIYLIGGFDPLVQLFFWGGTTGGVGVLLLITLTSIAVIGFFLRGAPRRVALAPLHRPGHRHRAAAGHQLPHGDQPVHPVRCRAEHRPGPGHADRRPDHPGPGHHLGAGAAADPARGVRGHRPRPGQRHGRQGRRRRFRRHDGRQRQRLHPAGPPMSDPVIVTVTDRDRLTEIGGQIARSFDHLDANRYLIPDPERRLAAMSEFFAVLTEHAGNGGGRVFETGDRHAVAVWFDRTVEPTEPEDYGKRIEKAAGSYAERFAELDEAFEADHPAERALAPGLPRGRPRLPEPRPGQRADGTHPQLARPERPARLPGSHQRRQPAGLPPQRLHRHDPVGDRHR